VTARAAADDAAPSAEEPVAEVVQVEEGDIADAFAVLCSTQPQEGEEGAEEGEEEARASSALVRLGTLSTTFFRSQDTKRCHPARSTQPLFCNTPGSGFNPRREYVRPKTPADDSRCGSC
jgi:hypothetical protein